MRSSLLPAIALALAVGHPAGSEHRIGLQEFEHLQRERGVVVVDVRDEAAYRMAHVPGAVSIPVGRLDAQADRLRAGHARVVIYCGGPADETCARATVRLRELGLRDARTLDGGLRRWLDVGGAVVIQPTAG